MYYFNTKSSVSGHVPSVSELRCLSKSLSPRKVDHRDFGGCGTPGGTLEDASRPVDLLTLSPTPQHTFLNPLVRICTCEVKSGVR